MNPQRGEIYFLPFGEGKTRPVVVVSRDTLNAGSGVLVVPFTTQRLEDRKNRQYCVFFHSGEGGLRKDCVAKTDELTVLDKNEINWKEGSIGRLTQEQMQKIVRAIRYAVRDDEL